MMREGFAFFEGIIGNEDVSNFGRFVLNIHTFLLQKKEPSIPPPPSAPPPFAKGRLFFGYTDGALCSVFEKQQAVKKRR